MLSRKRGRNDHATIVAKNEGSGVRKINVVCRAVPGQPCTLKSDRAPRVAHPCVVCKGGNLGPVALGDLGLQVGVRSAQPLRGRGVRPHDTENAKGWGTLLRNRVNRNQNQLALATRVPVRYVIFKRRRMTDTPRSSGLKPTILPHANGTAKAVPFHKPSGRRGSVRAINIRPQPEDGRGAVLLSGEKKAVEILSAAFVCTVAKLYGSQSIEWPQFH